jgi:SAM-dependent methyltransferase
VPTLEENFRTFDVRYGWPQQGEEWSAWWGGAEAQWYGTILPRIHAFVPTGTILEIAPGFGRWTQYLKALCSSLVLVDLSERCIDACRKRFASDSHIAYHVNDGRSLEMVEDGSVDFAFSFDSLVHAELDVVDGYVAELAKKLRPDGVALLHHSHMASYSAQGIPLPESKWRGTSVSAELVRESCERSGLCCPSQEIVNWGYDHLTDVFSLLAPARSRWSRPTEIRENLRFMDEAAAIAAIAPLYSLEQ